MLIPPYLKKGDTIGIMSPARKISKEELDNAKQEIRNNGYNIAEGNHLYSTENQFAGTDDQRASDLQSMIDNPDIKAIFFARGGYGCVRIIDKIDFSRFKNNPCWLLGYSDITVILNHVSQNFGIQTLHATMPISFHSNTELAISSLFDVLEGKSVNYVLQEHKLNKTGNFSGELVGGNLSVLYSMIGSTSFPETDNKILFIEDLDEYLYHIDRMMMALKRAGKLDNLKGLLVGAMTDMNDNTVPFGRNAEEIIYDIVSEFNYPVCYNIPAGHINNNCALTIGGQIKVLNNNTVLLNIK